MSGTVPENPKIYHMTHIGNLQGIFDNNVVYSDSQRKHRATTQHTNVGITEIKRRRLEELEVRCNPGTKVGDYVPFYFCPRSVMLFLIYKGNHPDLSYNDGQDSIVYLQADLRQVVQWANENGRKWAFSDRNAGARYAFFYNNFGELDKINWEAVNSTDFRDPLIKDGKQAEFLLHESFPVDLVAQIGVRNRKNADNISLILENKNIEKTVEIKPEWYF